MNVLTILLSCVPSILTGVFLFFFQHKQEKRERNEEMRDNIRNKYIKLIVDLTLATHALSEANTEALRTGGNTEELQRALAYAREIKHKHRDFMEVNGIRQIF